MHGYNRFAAHSVFGLRAEHDAAIADLHRYGWAPGLAFTLAELGRPAAGAGGERG